MCTKLTLIKDVQDYLINSNIPEFLTESYINSHKLNLTLIHKIIDKFFQKNFFLRCSVGNNYCRFVIVSRQFTDFPAMGFKLFGNWNIKDIKKPIILIYN